MNDENELRTKVKILVEAKFVGDYDAAFAHYDKDSNGLVSYAELIGLLNDAHVGNWLTRGAWAKGIIERLDKDGDGCISKDELFSQQ